MRKMFVVSVCVAVVATLVVASSTKNATLWENVDAQGVCGGVWTCYVVDNEETCPGGTTECRTQICSSSSIFCPSWKLNVYQGTRYYYSGSTGVESGGKTTIDDYVVQCYIVEHCERRCFAHINGNDYCAMSYSESDPGKKQGKKPGKTGC